jgi:hypothetical protein
MALPPCLYAYLYIGIGTGTGAVLRSTLSVTLQSEILCMFYDTVSFVEAYFLMWILVVFLWVILYIAPSCNSAGAGMWLFKPCICRKSVHFKRWNPPIGSQICIVTQGTMDFYVGFVVDLTFSFNHIH